MQDCRTPRKGAKQLRERRAAEGIPIGNGAQM
jgi:hypothetical protein